MEQVTLHSLAGPEFFFEAAVDVNTKTKPSLRSSFAVHAYTKRNGISTVQLLYCAQPCCQRVIIDMSVSRSNTSFTYCCFLCVVVPRRAPHPSAGLSNSVKNGATGSNFNVSGSSIGRDVAGHKTCTSPNSFLSRK